MNNIYSLVWSKARGAWVVASELARYSGKSKSSKVGAPRRAKTLQASALAVALAGVCGVSFAEPLVSNALVFKDGVDHEQSGGEFDYIEVRKKASDTTIKTTLTVTNVTIDDERTDKNHGAVFVKGGNIDISDSTVQTTGKRSGLQAYSAQQNQPATELNADKVTVNTKGESAHGVFVYIEQLPEGHTARQRSDATATFANGTINTKGDKASGLLVGGSGDPDVAGKGTLNVSDSSITTIGKDAKGLRAEYLGVANLTDTHITTSGNGATGVDATTGAEVNFTNGSITTMGDKTSAVYVKDATVTLNNVVIASGSDKNSGRQWAVKVDSGSELTMNDGSVTALGNNMRGINANDGSNASISDVNVTTAGDSGHGVQSINDGTEVILNDAMINTNGVYALGAHAQLGGVLTGSNNTITTTGDLSMGVEVDRGGQIDLSGGSITTRGDGAAGARAHSGKQADATAGSIILKDVRVATSGKGAIGLMAGDEDGPGGPVTAGNITFDIGSVTTTGDNAHAARAVAGSKLTIDNAALKTSGESAHGIAATDKGTQIDMTGGSITTTGANSAGLHLQDGVTVTLDGVNVASAGASIKSKLTSNNETQHITIKGESSLIENNGILWDVSRDTDATGTATLAVEKGAVVWGNVVENGGAVADLTKTVMNVDKDAFWVGVIVGSDDAQVGDGDSQQFDDSPIEQLVTGTGSTATFANGANIAESVSAGMHSRTSFNGNTSIGGDVQGMPAAQLAFNGPTSIGGSVNGINGAQFGFNGSSTHIGGNVNLTGEGTQLSGGTVDAPIQVAGDAEVASGAVLGGNLNVAGALRGSGGALSPGNSVGQQSYGSSAGFSGDYHAEINAAGKSDLITITSGNFDLTGINLYVSEEDGNGGYKLNHDYTIVKTGDANGISSVADNKFANDGELVGSLSKSLVKLDPVSYGDDNVKIRVSLDDDKVSNARRGLSSNQNATLDGVLSVMGQNVSADAALQSPDYKDALNQLSGELHASTQAALLQNSSIVSRTLTQRMRGNLGAGMLPGALIAQADGSLPAGAMPSSAAYPLWAQVVGNWGTLDSDGNAAKVKTDTAGLFVGGDTEVGSGWRVGGALGYTDGRVKVDDRGSRSDVESYTAALYAGNSWTQDSGKLNFLLGAAYTHHDVDSRRNVNVGGSQTLKADYRANTTQLFTELGYAMPVGERSVVEPYLGLAWIDQKAKSFTESGGAAALRGKSQSDDMTTFTLGLRGQTAIDMGASSAKVFAGLGWRHASGDVDPSRRLSFVEGGGTSFNVSGAPIAKNAAVVDLGFEMSVGNNTAMGLGYSGQYGDDNADHSGMLFLRTRF